MSTDRRRIVIAATFVLMLIVAAVFGLRGCRTGENSHVRPDVAIAPLEARPPSAAQSARKGQIYFHRDLGLAKIIPGEGLTARFPDPAAEDQQNYQSQSDRLSPDATRMAFGRAEIREIDGHFGAFPPNAIYVRQIGTADPARLALRIAGEIHNFVWSSKGDSLAFVSWSQEDGIRNRIFDLASTRVIEVRMPTYHVDGKERTMTIAAWAPGENSFLVADDGWLYLVRTEHKGTAWSWIGKKRVTADRQTILTPPCSFSPDGRRASFVAIEKVGMSLQVVDIEGGSQRTIIAGGKFTDLFPVWSPDGREIAWSGAHLDETGQRAGRSGIYTTAIDAPDATPRPVLEEVHPPEILRLRLIDWR